MWLEVLALRTLFLSWIRERGGDLSCISSVASLALPQKHDKRLRLVLLSDLGCGTVVSNRVIFAQIGGLMQENLTSLITEQYEFPNLFEPERWPHRPYCSNDYGYGMRVRSLKDALKHQYIQANPPYMRIWSIYDVDRPGGGLAWETTNLPPPSWVSVNKENRHAHLVYGLSAPVLTVSVEARQAPLRYLNAVEQAFIAILGGDPDYAGLLTKNPAHPTWYTIRGPQLAYDLGHLAQYVNLDNFKARQGEKVQQTGLGRNVTLFDFGRLWSYKHVTEYQRQAQPHATGFAAEYKNTRNSDDAFTRWQYAIVKRCESRNGDFARPLGYSEVKQIAKSVAKWTWSKYSGVTKNIGYVQSERRAGAVAKNTLVMMQNLQKGLKND